MSAASPGGAEGAEFERKIALETRAPRPAPPAASAGMLRGLRAGAGSPPPGAALARAAGDRPALGVAGPKIANLCNALPALWGEGG